MPMREVRGACTSVDPKVRAAAKGSDGVGSPSCASRRPAAVRGPTGRARGRSRTDRRRALRGRRRRARRPVRCRARRRCCAASLRSRRGAAPILPCAPATRVSDHANSSTSPPLSRPCRTAKSPTVVARANLFHGQKSWQSSQPKMRLPMAGAQLFGNRAAQLDRQIRDAAARVELVRRDDGLRGADVEARPARAAVLGDGRVGRQRQVRVELAEQEPRAVAVEQIRVLADPAEAGVARERLLEHGRAVDEDAIAELRRRARAIAVGESLQPLAQHLVIVAAERVARDIARRRIRERGARVARSVRPVAHARRDHPDGARHELGGPRALAAVPLHVAHRPVATEREPALEPPLVGRRDRSRRSPSFAKPRSRPTCLMSAASCSSCAGGWDGHGAGSLEVGLSIIAADDKPWQNDFPSVSSARRRFASSSGGRSRPAA